MRFKLAKRAKPIIECLGLHRPALRAWTLYDWANSAVLTTIIAAIFPIYFYRVAGVGLSEGVATRRFAAATLVAMIALAMLAPLLGAIADKYPIKKRLLAAFLSIGALAAAAMMLVHTGQWLFALVLLVIVEFCVAATLIFYDSLLPHIASGPEIDRVSATGYALGYMGGGLLLGLNLAWIQHPQWFGLPSGDDLTESQATLPTRLAFASVAVWWMLFSIPLLLRVPEPHIASPQPTTDHRVLKHSWEPLREGVAALLEYRQAGKMLLAFLIYGEGIGTIIKMAAIYGAEIGLDSQAMIRSILTVQFVGIPCTVLFGLVAGKLGIKRTIFAGIAIYLGIAALSFRMKSDREFLLLALMVGAAQGGTQSLSRSLFASLVPKDRSAQFFSLFALGEKVAGMLGPGLFVVVSTQTGSSRYAVASVVVFFVIGGLLLRSVDVDEGRDQAASA